MKKYLRHLKYDFLATAVVLFPGFCEYADKEVSS